MNVKKIVRAVCPGRAMRLLRLARTLLAPAKLAEPVVQIYINDGDIETTAGFNNYPSFLAAGVQTSGTLHIVLRDAEGRKLVEQREMMSHFETKFLDIKTLLKNNSIHSQFGLISLKFFPNRLRSSVYKRLGTLTSHFFMFYKGAGGGVAMVHPSSTLDTASQPSGAFLTNQVIETNGLESVDLYQCNPSNVEHKLTIGLQDAETKEPICRQELVLPPLGVRKVRFVAGNDFVANKGAVRVYTSSLPTANSKPMLCRRYSMNRFSMSHS